MSHDDERLELLMSSPRSVRIIRLFIIVSGILAILYADLPAAIDRKVLADAAPFAWILFWVSCGCLVLSLGWILGVAGRRNPRDLVYRSWRLHAPLAMRLLSISAVVMWCMGIRVLWSVYGWWSPPLVSLICFTALNILSFI